MFRKLLLRVLSNLKPNDKEEVRKYLEDRIIEEKESGTKVKDKKKRSKKRMDEKNKEVIEEKKEETKKVEETPKDTQNTNSEEVGNKETTEKEETKGADENTNSEENLDNGTTVADTTEAGNGIRVEDLVTKAELQDFLSALNAKFEAVVKENQDLKDKYEKNDFGNLSKATAEPKKEQTKKYSSFDEYSRDFM